MNSMPVAWWVFGLAAVVWSAAMYQREPVGSPRRLAVGFILVVYGSGLVMATLLTLFPEVFSVQ